MGADAQLPMTGGSEYITESQLPSHSHPYYGPYFSQTNRLTGGPTFMTYMGRQLNASDAITNGVPDQATEVIGSGQAYYPKYIQTYMWTKVLYYDSIIYSASGDAMGTFAEVLGSLYPVGAQIYRTSAISAHPSDATKVQPFPTEAPLQQWQLVDNGSNTVPLEYLTQLGDSTSFCGRGTMLPSSAKQDLTYNYATIEGTEVTNFTPVVGTTKVLYKVVIAFDHQASDPLANFKLEVKEGSDPWTEITKSTDSSFRMVLGPFEMSAVLNLGDTTTDLSAGRTSTVRPTIGFRIRGREYQSNSTYSAAVNVVDYHFTGDASITHVETPVPPHVDIISMGPQTSALTYERTA